MESLSDQDAFTARELQVRGFRPARIAELLVASEEQVEMALRPEVVDVIDTDCEPVTLAKVREQPHKPSLSPEELELVIVDATRRAALEHARRGAEHQCQSPTPPMSSFDPLRSVW